MPLTDQQKVEIATRYFGNIVEGDNTPADHSKNIQWIGELTERLTTAPQTKEQIEAIAFQVAKGIFAYDHPNYHLLASRAQNAIEIVAAPLEARIGELEDAFRRQRENYTKLYEAVLGEGCFVGDVDPFEMAANHRKRSEQLTQLQADCAVKDEALRKSKQAIAWSHPYGGNSCAGEVAFDQSAQWIEDAGEAIDKALTTNPGKPLLDELQVWQKRTLTLSRLIWETRWQSDDQDYQDMVGMAAEINSGNFDAVDTSKPTPTKPEQE